MDQPFPDRAAATGSFAAHVNPGKVAAYEALGLDIVMGERAGLVVRRRLRRRAALAQLPLQRRCVQPRSPPPRGASAPSGRPWTTSTSATTTWCRAGGPSSPAASPPRPAALPGRGVRRRWRRGDRPGAQGGARAHRSPGVVSAVGRLPRPHRPGDGRRRPGVPRPVRAEPARLRPGALRRPRRAGRRASTTRPRRSSWSRSRPPSACRCPRPATCARSASCAATRARCWCSTRCRPGWAGPARCGSTSRTDVEPDLVVTGKGLSGGVYPDHRHPHDRGAARLLRRPPVRAHLHLRRRRAGLRRGARGARRDRGAGLPRAGASRWARGSRRASADLAARRCAGGACSWACASTTPPAGWPPPSG